jgi:uncharacterized membrane protein YtjA (UPF0391 family)
MQSTRVTVRPFVPSNLPEEIMLYWAAVFFVIAILAGIFGFFGIMAGAASIAKILFFAFLVLAVVSLLFGRRGAVKV